MSKLSTLQFKVLLQDSKPAIWRLIEVPASYNFWDLHVAIQDAMGWLDCHLHAFRALNLKTGQIDEIGIPDDEGFEGGPVFLPGWKVPVVQYFQRPGDRARYEYDFGDGWEHEVVLKAVGVRKAKTKYPRCVGGARACPPEDCGGSGGYAELLKTIADPADTEYESMMTWLGGQFDPQAFDSRQVRFDDPKKRWNIAFSDG